MTQESKPINDETIDALLRDWQQGDCVIGEHHFVFRFNPACPLSVQIEDGESFSSLAEDPVPGLMVVSQSCDIDKPSKSRPFIEVVPLQKVEPQQLGDIQKRGHGRYAFVPGVADKGLVADLERVMTLEKAVILGWKRIRGCRTDDEVRKLAAKLSRKRGRFAFPDDFNGLVASFNIWIKSKHRTETAEGAAFEQIDEIRVRASPGWAAKVVSLLFYFIRSAEIDATEPNDKHLSEWLKLLRPNGRFRVVDGILTSLEDMTARDYVESDQYDLDAVSPASPT